MKRSLVLLALAGSLSSPAFANLITNGGFEAYNLSVPIPNPGGATVFAGSSAIFGWTVGGTSVDLIRNFAGAITDISVDMLGTPGPGSLSQSFATVVGTTYQLSFDLGFNSGGHNGTQATPNLLAVSLDGAAPTDYFGTTTPKTYYETFKATSTLTSLSFSSATSGYSGAVLDNVSVAAVPEPSGWALLLAGVATLGYVGRRRGLAATGN